MLYHYSWGIITLLNNEHMHIRLLEIHIFWFLPKKMEGASASLPLTPIPGHLRTCVKSFKETWGQCRARQNPKYDVSQFRKTMFELKQ
jgi:hypothetical protein